MACCADEWHFSVGAERHIATAFDDLQIIVRVAQFRSFLMFLHTLYDV